MQQISDDFSADGSQWNGTINVTGHFEFFVQQGARDQN